MNRKQSDGSNTNDMRRALVESSWTTRIAYLGTPKSIRATFQNRYVGNPDLDPDGKFYRDFLDDTALLMIPKTGVMMAVVFAPLVILHFAFHFNAHGAAFERPILFFLFYFPAMGVYISALRVIPGRISLAKVTAYRSAPFVAAVVATGLGFLLG